MIKKDIYLREFPHYDSKLYIPKGWFDGSHHNNACPHAEKEKGGYTACIFQDYVDINKRQGSLYDRYICLVTHDDDTAEVFPNIVYEVNTNDIEVVKRFVKDVEERFFS